MAMGVTVGVGGIADGEGEAVLVGMVPEVG